MPQPQRRQVLPIAIVAAFDDVASRVLPPGVRVATWRDLEADHAAPVQAGAHVPRVGQGSQEPREFRPGPLCAAIDGFSLHAAVRIPAGATERLEKLCRLCGVRSRPKAGRQRQKTVERDIASDAICRMMLGMPSKNFRPATTYPAVVGYVLGWHRDQASMNQNELAQLMGMSPSTWSRIERGESALTMDQLAAVAQVLEVEPGRILRDADNVARQLTRRGVQVERKRVPDAIGAGLALLAGAALVALVSSALNERDGK